MTIRWAPPPPPPPPPLCVLCCQLRTPVPAPTNHSLSPRPEWGSSPAPSGHSSQTFLTAAPPTADALPVPACSDVPALVGPFDRCLSASLARGRSKNAMGTEMLRLESDLQGRLPPSGPVTE